MARPFYHKPICRPDQKKIYGVARNEAAEILCQVDAYPPPESFKWSFNNTAETIDMPQSGYRVHAEQASSLTYTPLNGTKADEPGQHEN
uniref:Ig-like domain-containing protein n=1 Tax=Anopheles minimus TaxID=112268 RepID=A0A182VQT9_9DIPT